jgi:hypothetical protein
MVSSSGDRLFKVGGQRRGAMPSKGHLVQQMRTVPEFHMTCDSNSRTRAAREPHDLILCLLALHSIYLWYLRAASEVDVASYH